MSVLWGWISNKPFWSWADLDLFGRLAHSGVKVSNTNALTCTAYYAGVSLIAQTLAQVPLPLYRRLERGKERAYDHQLYSLLHDEPNPYMCAFTFKETLQGHVLTWGNAFAEIEWEPNMDVPRALWPLRPNAMQVGLNKGELRYIYTLPSGETVTLPANRILHIPGFGFDGLIGYDPITLVREAIGLSKATEEFGARFFSGGTTMSGVITHPNKLSQQATENMRKSWEEMHQGLSNQHRVAILEEGVDFKQIGVPPENAQFLETRKFQTSEIARFLHIPPHMIGDLEKATYSNIEHQGIEFTVYTMGPWFARWEQTVNRKLLSLADRQEYFAEFLVAGLLRGDMKSRYDSYAIGRQWGWLSANDIREKENENPVKGGDDYYMPLNMMPMGSEPVAQGGSKSLVEQKSQRVGLARFRAAEAYRPLFIAAGQKIVDQEVDQIRKNIADHLPPQKGISKKARADWFQWLDEFYKAFESEIRKAITPAIHSLAEYVQTLALQEVGSEQRGDLQQFLKEYANAFTKRYIDSSKGQLKALADENVEPFEALNTRLDEWGQKRAHKVGMNESVQVANAVAKVVFAGAGVIRLRWQAMGSETCPLCKEMDGRIVGIEQPFLRHDETLETEGASDLHVYRPTSHPPLHQGCVCQIVPA